MRMPAKGGVTRDMTGTAELRSAQRGTNARHRSSALSSRATYVNVNSEPNLTRCYNLYSRCGGMTSSFYPHCVSAA